MKIALTILQVLLALHTGVGALWKLANSERTMPSLAAIPHGVWLSLSVLELLCVVALLVPLYNKRAAGLATIGAGLVGMEMLFFSVVHLASGARGIAPVVYWLFVAGICAFVVYGRFIFKPIRRNEFA